MTWHHMHIFLTSLSLFSSETNRKDTIRKGMRCQYLFRMYPLPCVEGLGEVYALLSASSIPSYWDLSIQKIRRRRTYLCGEHVPSCDKHRTQNRHSLETS